jgi:photosystem II stability/assembly factor-like uncharacterized protein
VHRIPLSRRIPFLLLFLALLAPVGGTGLAAAAPPPVAAVAFTSATSGYALVGSPVAPRQMALWRSADGGRTWQAVPTGVFRTLGASVVDVLGITFADDRNGWLLLSGGAGACQLGVQVMSTADGGRTWHPAGQVVGSDGPLAMAPRPGAGPLLVNGSCASDRIQTYVWASHRWQAGAVIRPPVETGPPLAFSFRFTSATAGFAAVAYFPGTPSGRASFVQYVTADGGRTWSPRRTTRLPVAGMVNALSFATPDDGLAVTSDASTGLERVYRTRDGGRSWTDVTAAFGGLARVQGPVRIDDVMPLVGYAWLPQGPGTGLWRTDDGGQTWVRVGRPAAAYTGLTRSAVLGVVARLKEVDSSGKPTGEGAHLFGNIVSVPDGAGGTLTAVPVVRWPTADAYGQLVLFWHDTTVIGSDRLTTLPALGEESVTIAVAKATGGGIALTFARYRPNDPMAAPSLPPTTVVYRWQGGRLVASAPVPKESGNGLAFRLTSM